MEVSAPQEHSSVMSLVFAAFLPRVAGDECCHAYMCCRSILRVDANVAPRGDNCWRRRQSLTEGSLWSIQTGTLLCSSPAVTYYGLHKWSIAMATEMKSL
ncbi:hypothetical protein Pcinc_024031 [Petrolisthes cinctipes]|uniref:Secreted protein n=1 Tax=Petrolisthes cinctipes TaxID=88211 RepID=A0AAE1KEZ9_PETCI|nr:hypothetical protein Pcinc_024031 [Petrolisthes cinctipes]